MVRASVLVLTICATAAIARADGAGVYVLDGDKAVQTAFVKAIGNQRERVTVNPINEAKSAIIDGAVPMATLAKFRAVQKQVDEGWRAYLSVSIEFAASRLAAARTEAESLIPLPGGIELYADATLRLGIVYLHLKRVEDARAVFRIAMALDPERAITTAEFSPDVVEAVEATKLLRPPSQRVKLGVAPAEATVTVDGLEMGKGGREIDLARGQHVIIARARGYISLAQAVNVDDSHSVFTLRLDEDGPAQRLAAPDDGDLAQVVEGAMLYAELSEVVVVEKVLARGGNAIVVQRCVGIPARCSAAVEVGYPDDAGLDAAVVEAWKTVRVGELRYPPARRGESGGRTTSSRCELCRNPYVIGGVAAAVIAGVVIAFIATRPDPLPAFTIDPNDFISH